MLKLNKSSLNLKLWRFYIDNKKLYLESIFGSVMLSLSGNGILITKYGLKFLDKSLYLLFISMIKKLSIDLKSGYFLELNFSGLGYRFINLNNEILLRVGYSHYVYYRVPFNILIFGYKQKLVLFGIDLKSINYIGNIFRHIKKINLYKGKGIILKDSVVKLKEVKIKG